MANKEAYIEFIRNQDRVNGRGFEMKQKFPDKSREIKIFPQQPRWTRRLKQKS